MTAIVGGPPPSRSIIDAHRAVQQAAKEVLGELAPSLSSSDTEASIAQRATDGLHRRGLTQTWYHACPALVLLGTRSGLSISGREYQPASELVGPTNVVTVDLSPRREDFWGDCARTFFIEDGRVTTSPVRSEFARGKQFLESLHTAMPIFVQYGTTFHELFEWASAKISTAGFENLDFRGNVGHSLATHRADRRFIEAGDHGRLSEAAFFTFEPHVRVVGGRWGFKHENIFFFNADRMVEEL